MNARDAADSLRPVKLVQLALAAAPSPPDEVRVFAIFVSSSKMEMRAARGGGREREKDIHNLTLLSFSFRGCQFKVPNTSTLVVNTHSTVPKTPDTLHATLITLRTKACSSLEVRLPIAQHLDSARSSSTIISETLTHPAFAARRVLRITPQRMPRHQG